MRNGLAIAAIAVWCLSSFADSFNAEVRKGHGLLKEGNAEAALEVYRNLQIEEPESGLLYYSIGCANYEKALTKIAEEAPDEAIEALNLAKDNFERARVSSDPRIRTGADYNLANCRAQEAKLRAGTGDRQGTVEAFEASIEAYEQFLEAHPGHEGARKNLEHMRYLLKKMLQNPPPQQENQDQQQGEKEQQDSEDKQNQDQDQPQEQPEDQQQQDQKDQQQDQEQKDQEQKDQQQQDQEQQPQPQSSSEEQNLAQEDEQPQGDESQEPEDRQTVEAILQSLEEMDKREQQDLRHPRTSQVGREWW